MSHDYHEGAPNYNQYQLYYDGCTECKLRAGNPELMFAYIKDLPYAWSRAIRHGQDTLVSEELPVSETEGPVLRTIYALAVALEKHGIPFGFFPGKVAQDLREMLRAASNTTRRNPAKKEP